MIKPDQKILLESIAECIKDVRSELRQELADRNPATLMKAEAAELQLTIAQYIEDLSEGQSTVVAGDADPHIIKALRGVSYGS